MKNLEKILLEYKDIPESKMFMESLYEYYKLNGFTHISLERVSYLTKINIKVIEDFLYDYAKTNLKMSKNEFIGFVRQEKLKLKEEKAMAKEKEKPIYIGKENPVLLEKGISTKYLWTNEEEKEFFLKTIYEYSKTNGFSEESAKKFAQKLNITPVKFLDLIKLYMVDYLNFDKGDQARINNKRLKDCYKGLIEANDTSEFVRVVDECDYTIPYVITNFKLFRKFYTEEEVNHVYDLYKKLREEQKSMTIAKRSQTNKKRGEENQLKRQNAAKEMVQAYIDNSSSKDFLIKNNVSDYKFNEQVKMVKECDEDLYNKYVESRLNNNITTVFTPKQLKEMISNMKNGYDVNGEHRNFDVLDYLFITDISITTILQSKRDYRLTADEEVTLKRFKNTYVNCEKYSSAEEKAILDEQRRINMEYDKRGRIIENSGRLITEEEKQGLLNYLHENNIVVNRLTYNAALKRYINGYLNIDLEKAKKLVLDKNNK